MSDSHQISKLENRGFLHRLDELSRTSDVVRFIVLGVGFGVTLVAGTTLQKLVYHLMVTIGATQKLEKEL